MGKICTLLGYTRQNYYKQLKACRKEADIAEILNLAKKERKLLPRAGTRKIYSLICNELKYKGIKCGRDKLFKVLRQESMLIRPKKRYIQTTMSKHWLRKYPNLIKGKRITAPEQVWVSDITYLKTDEGNCYLTMITDAFSRRIMGYNLADNMTSEESVKALRMAIKSRIYPDNILIHHSDRGIQFCSGEYVSTANNNEISLSMTEKYDPYENALAERMNRTIKEEFYLDGKLKNIEQASFVVKEAVELYNTYRPHLALQMRTPEHIHRIPDKGLTRDLF